MTWDIDIVPVIARNTQYIIPPVGTLSSVAAYNLPMLSWLHLPAQWLTGDVWWTILLTLLTFNLLSTIAVYALGWLMVSPRVGLVAAALFTFSEVGISSSYTAWAQLLLPGFFVMVMLCLWLWVSRESGRWLALAGIIATAAFMTHFSAVLLYPAMLLFALITRARWQWGWLIAGAIVVLLMFTPYLMVQLERDFVDVRAFATQEPLVADDVLAQYEVYKPGVFQQQPPSEPTPTPADTTSIETGMPIPSAPAPQRPRWLRAIDYAVQAPTFYWQAMTTAFVTRTPAISARWPQATPITRAFLTIPHLMLVISGIAAGIQVVRKWPQHRSLKATAGGRILLVIGFITIMIALMILTRTIGNDSYWMGFMGLEFVIAAYAVSLLPDTRQMTIAIAIAALAYIGLQTTERSLRLAQHNDEAFSAYNVSLYRHIEATADYIAADWQGDESLTIRYDILQDVNFLWWVPAWHSIDPFYTMGMNVDFLLAYHHGLQNTNDDPIGTVPINQSDYIVVYTPSLDTYDLAAYTLQRFGAIIVLQPKQ